MDLELYLRLGIALGLGLLVGLQREVAKTELAGIRTFALIGLLGGATALFDDGWLVAVGLGAVALTLAVSNSTRARHEPPDPGMTTEIAALAMFLIGAAVVAGHVVPGLVMGAAVGVLLHSKERLHGFAGRLDEGDLKAIFQLSVISLIVLPLLPDQDYGPYGVLNPRQIWWMVVLIVAIGLGGYVAFKLLGTRGGALASGLLGGLISSTATTLSYARHARESPAAAPVAALVVLVASGVVYGRLLVEIALVAPSFFPVAAPRLGFMLAFVVVLSVVVLRRLGGSGEAQRTEHGNPAELGAALIFAVLYAAILLVVAWVEDRFGARALYLVAVASGLTDMDAITLSTSRLVAGSRLDPDTGWRLVVIASLSNLAFKGGIAAVVGGPALARPVALLFGVVGLGGALLLAFG